VNDVYIGEVGRGHNIIMTTMRPQPIFYMPSAVS